MSRPAPLEADLGEAQQTIEWLLSDEALSYSRRLVTRAGLGRDLAEDLVQIAITTMIRWSRGPSARPLENPAAYGSAVVRNRLRRLLRGRKFDETELDESALGSDELDVGYPEDTVEVQLHLDDGDAADPLRVALELQQQPAWVHSAALTFVTIAVHDSDDLAQLPSPLAGARSDQALCWPALHLAGHADLVVTYASDAVRRRRSRYIRRVLEAVNAAFVEAAARGEVQGG